MPTQLCLPFFGCSTSETEGVRQGHRSQTAGSRHASFHCRILIVVCVRARAHACVSHLCARHNCVCVLMCVCLCGNSSSHRSTWHRIRHRLPDFCEAPAERFSDLFLNVLLVLPSVPNVGLQSPLVLHTNSHLVGPVFRRAFASSKNVISHVFFPVLKDLLLVLYRKAVEVPEVGFIPCVALKDEANLLLWSRLQDCGGSVIALVACRRIHRTILVLPRELPHA
jgi:hypothetical protein